jgi:ParB family transcriptional regulator, chromosome partitioning protein
VTDADTSARTLEEVARALDLEVVLLPVGEIDPDPANPNLMDDALYESLRADIEEHGFTQPILVRRGENGRYQLIDGEHRWRAVAELGYGAIPSVVTDDDGDDAKVRLLTMNRLRGTFVPIKLAYVLADLAQRIPEDELRRRLGMEAGELRDHLRLANFTDELGLKLREGVEREDRAAPLVLTFVIRHEKDAAAIERVVNKVVGERTDRGQALAKICRAFEKGAKP